MDPFSLDNLLTDPPESQAFTSLMDNKKYFMVFDPDTKIIILGNSVNTHISNDKSFVVGENRPCQMNESCGIVGEESSPAKIITVEWSWKDNNGKVSKDLLYHPESPVSILVVTLYSRSMNNLNGTLITSQAYQSAFTKNLGKHIRVIQYPCICLPEILVNDRSTAYTSFMSFFTKAFPILIPENLSSNLCSYLPKNEEEGAKLKQCSLYDLSEKFENAIDDASSSHLVEDKVR